MKAAKKHGRQTARAAKADRQAMAKRKRAAWLALDRFTRSAIVERLRIEALVGSALVAPDAFRAAADFLESTR